MKKLKSLGITIAVAILCVLPLIGAVALCSYEVEKNLEIEMQNILRDVAEQNKVVVQKEIEERFSLAGDDLHTTYQSEWLEELLDIRAFSGEGYGCIVGEDGQIIAHSKGSPIYEQDNFFDCFEENEGSDAVEEFREVFRERFRAGKSGMDSFMHNGVQDFYYTPLKLENGQLQWYMITVVPDEVLVERVQPIESIINRMFIIMVIIIGCGIAVFAMAYYVRKKELLALAYTDPLTQGYNYSYFKKEIKKNRGVHGFILAMDISGFKIINNTCGIQCSYRCDIRCGGIGKMAQI